jgi:hypothetical protein
MSTLADLDPADRDRVVAATVAFDRVIERMIAEAPSLQREQLVARLLKAYSQLRVLAFDRYDDLKALVTAALAAQQADRLVRGLDAVTPRVVDPKHRERLQRVRRALCRQFPEAGRGGTALSATTLFGLVPDLFYEPGNLASLASRDGLVLSQAALEIVRLMSRVTYTDPAEDLGRSHARKNGRADDDDGEPTT